MKRYERIADELKALAHPLRLAILACIAGGLEEPVVVWRTLVQREEELQLALVAYHVQKLLAGGLIRLARTDRSGGVERHFYKVSARGRHLSEALSL